MYTLRVAPAPEIRVCDPFGSFEVYKDFTVKPEPKWPSLSSFKRPTSPSSQVAGIVVQCVEKTTSVKDANNTVYNTTDAVNTLTSGKVPYSNHKYLEYFTVKGAKSKYGDSFSTGPVVQYDQGGPQTYTTDDPDYDTYKTEGKIVMVGENWFISAENVNYKNLLDMGWIVETKTNPNPANGLNYMPFSQDIYDTLKLCMASNILTHRVVVEWTFDDPYTVVTSSINTASDLKASIFSTKKAAAIGAASPKSPSPSKSKSKGHKSKIISTKKIGGRRNRCANRHRISYKKTKRLKIRRN